jgi:hypothetical protein
MFRVELLKAARRWRTWLLAAAIAAIPAVIVFAIRVSPPQPAAAEDAPPFLFQIATNGPLPRTRRRSCSRSRRTACTRR